MKHNKLQRVLNVTKKRNMFGALIFEFHCPCCDKKQSMRVGVNKQCKCSVWFRTRMVSAIHYKKKGATQCQCYEVVMERD